MGGFGKAIQAVGIQHPDCSGDRSHETGVQDDQPFRGSPSKRGREIFRHRLAQDDFKMGRRVLKQYFPASDGCPVVTSKRVSQAPDCRADFPHGDLPFHLGLQEVL